MRQYVCPSCDEPGHIRINEDSSARHNARCTSCGWTGDSEEAANAADEWNRAEERRRKNQKAL
jgi:hypothetical protein